MTLSKPEPVCQGVQISLRGPAATSAPPCRPSCLPQCPARVWLNYSARARAAELGEEWNVKACAELVAALGELDVVSDARLVY
jgi:hypothetical protein